MSDSGWRSLDDDFPGWRDAGPAALRAADGTEVTGDLIADVGFDGEDEYPVWTLRRADGTEVSIFDYESWKSLR